MKGPLDSVEVSYFLHATEDPEKVRAAIARLSGRDAEAQADELLGHFGNKILRVTVSFKGGDADSAFRTMVSQLPGQMRLELVADLEEHLDDHSALFLRFDKERLVSGFLSAGTTNSVRVKVKPRAFLVRGGARDFYSKLFRG